MTEQRTAEQEYQSDYYQSKKSERTAKLRDKWENDPEFKKKERERARRRRSLIRAERAKGRFEAMVEEKREREEATKPPRFAMVNGESVQVWTTGSLGREVGRSARAVRTWMRRGDLPGASVFTRDGTAWFTKEFCRAVREACKRLYYFNGRGNRKVLRRLIMEELEQASISYVPFGGAPEDRVVAGAA